MIYKFNLITISPSLSVEKLVNSIGDRISYCRSAAGFTRKELAELWGQASVPTISRWELDIIEPASKKIESIAEFFCSKGLIVSSEWIQEGVGIAPSLLNIKDFSEGDFDSLCDETFLHLNKSLRDFSYYKVTSNFFAPVIRYGDYVGGIKLHTCEPQHQHSLVFVVHENSVYVGLMERTSVLVLKNPQGSILEFPKYDVLAKICWTAIRP